MQKGKIQELFTCSTAVKFELKFKSEPEARLAKSFSACLYVRNKVPSKAPKSRPQGRSSQAEW